MALQIRRGLAANRTSITPAAGEIIFTTDTNQIFIGDGTTPGGNPLTINAPGNLTIGNISVSSPGTLNIGGNILTSQLVGTLANLTSTSGDIVNLFANAATQATALDTLTANAASQAVELVTLTSNAAAQTVELSTLTANAASQATVLDSLTSNAATQANDLTTLYSNAAAQADSLIVLNSLASSHISNLASLTANAASQAASLDTLNANAATQATSIIGINANLIAANLAIDNLNSNVGTIVASTIPALDANVGAYQIYANSTIYTNSNVTNYLQAVTGNIIPAANVTYTLGNVNYQWKEIHVSGNTIFMGGIPLSTSYIDDAGSLTLGANSYIQFSSFADVPENTLHDVVAIRAGYDGVEQSNFVFASNGAMIVSPDFRILPRYGLGSGAPEQATGNITIGNLIALSNVIGSVSYTPANAANYNSTINNIQDALDELAERIKLLGG